MSFWSWPLPDASRQTISHNCMSESAAARSNLKALLLALAVIVAGAIVAASLQLGAPDGPPLSARAYGVTGSVALARWHQAMGFRVKLVEGRPYRISGDVRLLYILQPNTRYAFAREELATLRRWVEAGGILVLAIEREVSYPFTRRGPDQYALPDESPLGAFGFDTALLETRQVTAALALPLLDGLPVDEFQWRRDNLDNALALDAPNDALIHAQVADGVLIASRSVGAGRVIVLAGTYPFTNEGLRQEANARLILNLAGLVPPGSVIAFDEFHHGARQTPSLLGWMLSAPAGLAVSLALTLIGIYIVWSGRRFGRPFVMPELHIRREPSEYVLAIANLSRAAGQRNAALLRYHGWLKRKLAQPWRINPTLPDPRFVDELRAVGAPVDYERLARLLDNLQRGARSDAHFVRLAREAAEF